MVLDSLMNRERLDAAIQQIRDYTKGHQELCAAHHFLYDLPLDKKAGKPAFVVMGINPGEGLRDRRGFSRAYRRDVES
jgi:hypothetical protein